jgi:hypothetical protein
MLKRISVKFVKASACALGLRLPVGAEVAIDVLESQLPEIQALVDAGDVEVAGMSPAPVVVEKPVEKKGK